MTECGDDQSVGDPAASIVKEPKDIVKKRKDRVFHLSFFHLLPVEFFSRLSIVGSPAVIRRTLLPAVAALPSIEKNR